MFKQKKLIVIAAAIVFSLTIAINFALAQSGLPITEPIVPLPESKLDHRVVYFVGEDDRDIEDLVAPAKLAQSLGTITATSWEQVIELNEQEPIQGLIIHSSALADVDYEWVSQAYWRGVVIVGINMIGSEMAELVGNPCVAMDKFAAEPVENFVIVQISLEGDNPSDIARVRDAYNRSCGEDTAPDIRKYVSISGGRATDSLDNENSYNIFALQLSLYLDNI
jgi:hypothetical protein